MDNSRSVGMPFRTLRASLAYPFELAFLSPIADERSVQKGIPTQNMGTSFMLRVSPESALNTFQDPSAVGGLSLILFKNFQTTSPFWFTKCFRDDGGIARRVEKTMREHVEIILSEHLQPAEVAEHRPTGNEEETLIVDERSALTPSQMVEEKLLAWQKTSPLLTSHMQRQLKPRYTNDRLPDEQTPASSPSQTPASSPSQAPASSRSQAPS